MIEIEEIVKFIDGFSRPLVGSKQILESGYLQKVGIDSETSEEISIRGVCLRVHKPSEVVSIQTKISKPFPGSVIDAKCTCIAGSLEKCKHVVAVLRYVKRYCHIDSWSCTDGEAAWKKELKKAQEEIAVPVPLTEFCHGIEKTQEIFPKIQNFFQSEIFKVMVEKLPKDCTILKELRGRTSRSFVDESIIKKLVHRDLAPLTEFHLNAPPELAEFYAKYIVIPKEEAERVCSETVTQAKSDLWHQERQLRVTGCRAYDLFTYSVANHTNEEWAAKLEYMYFPTFRGNWATDYGKRNEGKALKLYSQKMNVKVFRCGLVINSTLPIFAFSPDGIVVSSSLPSRFIEVKCPTSGQQFSSNELLEKLDYIKIDPSNRRPVLKETHSYYGQIQFGLYLGGAQDADLIIYCERDQDVIIIPVTLNLCFAEEMMFVLRKTFFTNVLPYLFVSRNRLRKELKQVTN